MDVIGMRWSEWKSAVVSRRCNPQAVEHNGVISVWFYDIDRFEASIWRGDVPHGIITGGYSQEQNDLDLAEYDSGIVVFGKASEQRNYDGRLIVQPVTLGSGQWHYWHGEGDDVTSDPKTVGGGTPFQASSTSGSVTTSWSYRDPTWIAGGSLKYSGALLGDYVSFTIYAPATPITPSSGGNTGNCNLHPSGILIPAAGDGAWDVDLTAATPIPTSDFAPYSGFWNYELPSNMMGKGVLTPGVPGESKYHLIPARVDLNRFVKRERLLGTDTVLYEPTNINVSICLPEWKFECTLHNASGSHTVEAVWRVLLSRYWTTI